MDRVEVYPGQIPLETDILSTNKNAMIGLAKLAEAVLGTGPVLTGLPCTPGGGMNVSIGAGQVYQLDFVDSTAYSSLPADTTHQILKQGVLLDAVGLSCPAPATAGQSIAYLVEIDFQDTDSGSTLLPFYNASNPAVPYSGPSNSGVPSMTSRSGKCVVQVKAGTAATTGTQVPPAVDAGFIPAYVVTVAAGQVTIVSANIAAAAGAPFLGLTLPAAAPLNSPAFTGTPTAPTPAPNDNSQLVPTTAFVKTALTGITGPIYINSSVTLVPGVYLVDTSGGGFTVTLPLNPTKGMAITLIDALATWGINTFVLGRNGKTIMGTASDLTINVNDQQFTIWYNGTDWRLV
ncbi:hypothetical protein [Undibacterium sp.]|uniref:hypothetical protein n=1 Tax=Undibacterium sp. TaxID=1914977 RepID=UPI00374CA802